MPCIYFTICHMTEYASVENLLNGEFTIASIHNRSDADLHGKEREADTNGTRFQLEFHLIIRYSCILIWCNLNSTYFEYDKGTNLSAAVNCLNSNCFLK